MKSLQTDIVQKCVTQSDLEAIRAQINDVETDVERSNANSSKALEKCQIIENFADMRQMITNNKADLTRNRDKIDENERSIVGIQRDVQALQTAISGGDQIKQKLTLGELNTQDIIDTVMNISADL